MNFSLPRILSTWFFILHVLLIQLLGFSFHLFQAEIYLRAQPLLWSRVGVGVQFQCGQTSPDKDPSSLNHDRLPDPNLLRLLWVLFLAWPFPWALSKSVLAKNPAKSSPSPWYLIEGLSLHLWWLSLWSAFGKNLVIPVKQEAPHPWCLPLSVFHLLTPLTLLSLLYSELNTLLSSDAWALLE